MNNFIQSPLKSALFQGWFVIAFGFIGFIYWAGTYPLEQGVPGSGFLIAETEKIAVISPMTGLVTRVEKRLGDKVKEGEVLLEFDPKSIESNERTTLESIRGIEVSNASLLRALQARKEQIEAIKLQFNSMEKLMESGFASPNMLANIKSQLALTQSESQEMQSRIEQNESRLRELRERIVAIRHEMSLQKIRAPANGRVMNTSLHRPGVNITAGSQIMEIAPESDRLVIDARLPVDYATRITSGMLVDVMFPTISGSSSSKFQGNLEYVSADRLMDARTNQAYLECRVSLQSDDLRLADLGLRAGLPATIMVKTGPRTVLSYLTRPITERLARGMQ